MTQAISNATDNPFRSPPASRAQALPAGTRTFDLVLGDAVFGEAISERPEPVDKPREPAEAEEDDAAEREDAVREEDDEGEESAPSDDAAARPEAPVQAVEEGDAEGVRFEARDLRPGGGVRAKREAQVSARAIRAEITHAADVDVAALNSRELASRTTKTLTPDPTPEKFRPSAGGDAAAKPADARPAATANAVGADPSTPAADRGTAAPTPAQAASSATPAAGASPPVAGPSVPPNAPSAAPTPAPAVQAAAPVGATAVAAPVARAAQASPAISVRPGEGPRPQGAEPRPPARQAGASSRPAPERTETIATLQRGMASVLKAGGGTVTLRLTPEALGEVKVELNLKNGVANARFEASTDSARRLLSENMSTLREALEAKGVRVERMSVELRSASEASPEAARGERPGTDAGRAHQGQTLDDQSRGAGAETGAGSDGRAAEDHAARQHPAHPRSGRAGRGAEPPHENDDAADPNGIAPARTPAGVHGWIGLDTIA